MEKEIKSITHKYQEVLNKNADLLLQAQHHAKRFLDLSDAYKAIEEIKLELNQVKIDKEEQWREFMKLKDKYDKLIA